MDGLVGGLVGWNAGIITQSYATGAVRDLSPTSILIGGLVGLNVDPIEQSYAMGAVTSVGATGVYATNIGGLVGVNQGVTQGVDYDHGSIDQSYATGLVTGSPSYLHFGGITGGSSGGLTTNSYWDTQTTGLSSSAGGTGLTSDELKSGLPTGFDPAVWAISSDVNGGYPYLRLDLRSSENLTIDTGAVAEVSTPYAGLMIFAGTTGTLKIDNSSSFTGTVAGMFDQDIIDFADIDPTKVQSPSYSGNAAGGKLTVTDGSHIANIALLGNYLASTFVPSSDGHGGTLITDPPANQQSLLSPPHA